MRMMKKSNFRSVDVDKDGKFDVSRLPIFIQYLTNLDSDVNQVFQALQGQLRFGTTASLKRGENLFGQWVTVSDTGSANTEFTVTHSLSDQSVGIVPANYLVTSINKGGVVYTSGTAWTTTAAYFKCTTANTTVNIFLMP